MTEQKNRTYTLEEVQEILEVNEHVHMAHQDLEKTYLASPASDGLLRRQRRELAFAKRNRIETWARLGFSMPHWDIGE